MLANHVFSSVFSAAGTMPPGVGDKFNLITSWVTGIVSAGGVIGLLIIAGTMFFQNRRGEGADAGHKLGFWAMGCILAAAAAPIAQALLP